MNDRLYIFDTTLRDGEQVPGCQLNRRTGARLPVEYRRENTGS